MAAFYSGKVCSMDMHIKRITKIVDKRPGFKCYVELITKISQKY